MWEWGPFLGEEAKDKGVRITESSFAPHHPNVMVTKAKISEKCVNSTLAKTVVVHGQGSRSNEWLEYVDELDHVV